MKFFWREAILEQMLENAIDDCIPHIFVSALVEPASLQTGGLFQADQSRPS